MKSIFFIIFFIILFVIKIYCDYQFCRFNTIKEFIYKYKTWNNYKVIYTSITNGYDNILNPEFINYDYDYILFSDNYFNDSETIWEFYPIPNEINNLKLSPAKIERYVKINPHKCLSLKYNFSFYIDGNVIIKNDINLFMNKIKKQLGNFMFYIPKHPVRICLFEEMKVVVENKIDSIRNVFPQMEKFIKEGFPHNYGLPEANILIRYHLNSNIIKLMEDWWNIVKNGSYRDQLSFSYAAWKNNNTKFMYFDKKEYKEFFYKLKHLKNRIKK